jgi:hypothetical protein
VLQRAGVPMHVRPLEEEMKRLGFKHRRPPANPHQLASTLNSFGSPSRQPNRLQRVGHRTLALREWS